MSGTTKSTFQRLKVPLIVAKILLSFLLFTYVVAKVSPRNVWATMRAADPTLMEQMEASTTGARSRPPKAAIAS